MFCLFVFEAFFWFIMVAVFVLLGGLRNTSLFGVGWLVCFFGVLWVWDLRFPGFKIWSCLYSPWADVG